MQVIKYQKRHEGDVNSLKAEISKEFDKPISLSNSLTKKKIVDEYWMAEKNDLVIGTIGIIKLRNKNAILKSMFVKKEYRGDKNGVSKLLLKTAINWSKKEKIDNIFLGTMMQFKAAQKFYEKYNFYKINRIDLPTDFVHNPIDNVFYKLELNGLNYRIGLRKI